MNSKYLGVKTVSTTLENVQKLRDEVIDKEQLKELFTLYFGKKQKDKIQ